MYSTNSTTSPLFISALTAAALGVTFLSRQRKGYGKNLLRVGLRLLNRARPHLIAFQVMNLIVCSRISGALP